jgi:hypothetical protein
MAVVVTRWTSVANLARIGQEIRKVRTDGRVGGGAVEALRYKLEGRGFDSR